MKRGDVVTVAVPGDFGKPRPALVIQSALFSETGTLTVLLITSTLIEASHLRIPVDPTSANGLRQPSQIMVDKAMSVLRPRIGGTIGRLDAETLQKVVRALALFFDIA